MGKEMGLVQVDWGKKRWGGGGGGGLGGDCGETDGTEASGLCGKGMREEGKEMGGGGGDCGERDAGRRKRVVSQRMHMCKPVAFDFCSGEYFFFCVPGMDHRLCVRARRGGC